MPKSDAHDLYQVPLVYEALLGSSDQDLGFYSALGLERGGPVLDLATGSGRVALSLAAQGLEAWGLDREAAMLDLARSRSQGLALAPHWALGDLRSFDLGRCFPLVLLPYNGLQHLCTPQDLGDFFGRLNAHTEPGACFALDLHLPQPAILARDPEEWYGVQQGAEGLQVLAERSAYDPLAQVLTQTWAWRDAQGREAQSSLCLRQFFPQELEALLDSHGWRVAQRYGGFHREPLGPLSLKQVLVCERP